MVASKYQKLSTEVSKCVFPVFSHLVLTGVPVVQQACRDEERVIPMAALTVVPATVVTNFCLSSGRTDWMLTT